MLVVYIYTIHSGSDARIDLNISRAIYLESDRGSQIGSSTDSSSISWFSLSLISLSSNFILRHWRQKMSTEKEKQTACYLCGVRKPRLYTCCWSTSNNQCAELAATMRGVVKRSRMRSNERKGCRITKEKNHCIIPLQRQRWAGLDRQNYACTLTTIARSIYINIIIYI